MKGPVLAPPQQEMIMENRTALSPRNNTGSEQHATTSRSKNLKKGTAKRSTSAPAAPNMGDPWSDSSPSSPMRSPLGGMSAVITIPSQPAATTTATTTTTTNSHHIDNVPPPRPTQTTHKVIDGTPPPTDTARSRNSSKGTSSKGTIESNPADLKHSAPPPPPPPPPRSPSPTRRHRLKDPNSGQKERPQGLPLGASSVGSGSIQRKVRDPAEQEQALFEQRLCEDAYGVAIRKINQYGKANLRYVKCIHVDDLNDASSSKRSVSSRSASSKGRKKSGHTPESRRDPQAEKARHALVWGKKKDVQITLDHFTAVRVGKVTERAKRNPSPHSRILSLITNDPKHPALDIEAPTRMDRDKFARAFARFLDVPMEGDDSQSVHSAEFTPVTFKTTPDASTNSAPGDLASPEDLRLRGGDDDHPNEEKKEEISAPTTPPDQKDKDIGGFWQGAVAAANAAQNASYQSASHQSNDGFNLKAVVEMPNEKEMADEDKEDGSAVSSLTGHGYDQELVEELHNALNELRAELEDSRAEAARAVKVAEQAIQSAEKTSSQDWHNTVTHKAAEAAAQAQKRSAEAMAKQRLAEERLEGERRTAAFWRKQAEVAEEEAGLLQTRAAAAEVRKSAIEEQLDSERRIANTQIENMKDRIAALESSQFDALNVAVQRNRDLEIELEATRRDLVNSKERYEDVENVGEHGRNGTTRRKKPMMGRKKKSIGDPAQSKTLLESRVAASPDQISVDSPKSTERSSLISDDLSKLKAETAQVRQQYELLRTTTTAELAVLPELSKQLTDQVAGTLETSQAEIKRLRDRLASECASRRKLLNEVQDLRGIVRVYCRPMPPTKEDSIFNMPSQETLVLRRDKYDKSKKTQPMSFEFDRIFEHSAPQQDVYGEVQEVCLGVLDGFNITVMAFGPNGCGKTRAVLGEVAFSDETVSINDHGIQLQALKQLFSIAKHRSERFKDTFSLSIVEVHDERISDLLAGTAGGDEKGHVIVCDSTSSRRKSKKEKTTEDDASSGRGAKLEIRSDLHGETVVQGALTVEVESFDEVVRTWVECTANRRKRLEEQEIDVGQYEAASHVITTVKVTSANIATGHGVVGKLQFVDMAAADIVPRQSDSEGKESDTCSAIIGEDWRFSNRSLETLGDVVVARSQFVRSVPYRNSTLTHLLRDSLDGDTKVIFLACVSSDPADIQESTATLRLASRMRQVTIGKATKHSLTSP